jgi:hypothetical protein
VSASGKRRPPSHPHHAPWPLASSSPGTPCRPVIASHRQVEHSASERDGGCSETGDRGRNRAQCSASDGKGPPLGAGECRAAPRPQLTSSYSLGPFLACFSGLALPPSLPTITAQHTAAAVRPCPTLSQTTAPTEAAGTPATTHERQRLGVLSPRWSLCPAPRHPSAAPCASRCYRATHTECTRLSLVREACCSAGSCCTAPCLASPSSACCPATRCRHR